MHPSNTFLKHDMNHCCTILDSPNHCMLASSSILRRQQFLIRSLTGYHGGISMDKTPAKCANGTATEADAETILKRITPSLDPTRHKGQAGKIAVFGGCREYTGAPYFAAISALKIREIEEAIRGTNASSWHKCQLGLDVLVQEGNTEHSLAQKRGFTYQGADLSHVFCTKDAGAVIKSYSPELIVHPLLEESYSVRDDEKASISNKVLTEVAKWMERFDCIIVGPGLGRDPFLLGCVSEIMKLARQSNTPIVIDGDGLFLVTNNLDLVKGYPLAVLTPNVNEYKRLIQKVLDCEVNEQDASEQLLSLARRIGGVTILRKGKSDLISDGETVNIVSVYGSPRRCGGQGDILSGSVALFSSWARQQTSATKDDSNECSRNPMVLGCIAGSALLRKAASLTFMSKKRATLTTDIIEYLGESLEDTCPAI